MTRLLFFTATLLLAGSNAMAAATTPGADVNALPSGPKAPAARGSQEDAETAYEQARAECRRVARDLRRECVKGVQLDYEKTLRSPKPPRPPRRDAR
jgi:hypothetical protein